VGTDAHLKAIHGVDPHCGLTRRWSSAPNDQAVPQYLCVEVIPPSPRQSQGVLIAREPSAKVCILSCPPRPRERPRRVARRQRPWSRSGGHRAIAMDRI